jgi:hypothetical protein
VSGWGGTSSSCATSSDIIWKGWFDPSMPALVADPTMKVVCSPGKKVIAVYPIPGGY